MADKDICTLSIPSQVQLLQAAGVRPAAGRGPARARGRGQRPPAAARRPRRQGRQQDHGEHCTTNTWKRVQNWHMEELLYDLGVWENSLCNFVDLCFINWHELALGMHLVCVPHMHALYQSPICCSSNDQPRCRSHETLSN